MEREIEFTAIFEDADFNQSQKKIKAKDQAEAYVKAEEMALELGIDLLGFTQLYY